MNAAVRAAALLLATLLLVGCGRSDPQAVAPLPDTVPAVSAEARVTVVDNDFAPEELVVEVGTEVIWEWEGNAAHDVVGDGFNSGIQDEGTFAHTFEAVGSYAYVCTLHAGMEATVLTVPADD